MLISLRQLAVCECVFAEDGWQTTATSKMRARFTHRAAAVAAAATDYHVENVYRCDAKTPRSIHTITRRIGSI